MGVSLITELNAFRQDYPRMLSRPEKGFAAVLKGRFAFSANYLGKHPLVDSYQLAIRIPIGFPKEVPRVYETGNRIPNDGNHHVNPDGSLCLGSPLRLKWIVLKHPTLLGFAAQCLVPYLYSMSRNLLTGEPFVFNELPHGSEGELNDYQTLFCLKSNEQVIYALELLTVKKRHANKRPCPCDCGLRLGKCRTHHRLNEFRKIGFRPYYKSVLARMK